MSYITKALSMFSTEQAFINTLINTLTSFDNRIVCETQNISEQFSNGNKPTIVFNINNSYKIEIMRSQALPNATSSYIFTIKINGVNKANTTVTLSNATLLDEGERSLKFGIISTDKIIALWFIPYNKSFPDYILNTISIHDGDLNIVSYSTNTNSPAIQSNFIRTDTIGNNDLHTVATRLNYVRNDNNIELIKNKVILKNGIVERDFDGIWDCSKVTKDSIVTIDNANYYALNENTLVAIG